MTKTIKTIKLLPAKGIRTSVSTHPALGVQMETLYLYNAAAVNRAIEQINTSETDTLKNATNAEQAAKDANAAAKDSAEQARVAHQALTTVKGYAAAVEEAIEMANTYAETAQASDAAANAAMQEAQSAADAAAQSANKTEQNEKILQGYVDTANEAATTATSNAASAKSSADAAADFMARTAAAQSEAETSKTSAAQSAINAANSAKNAATSESNAQTSMDGAAIYANAAATSASNAAGYAANAQNAQSAAEMAANNAATSEQNAAQSASGAKESADAAAQSAVSAQESKSAAGQSELNAAKSESAALQSAQEAQNAQVMAKEAQNAAETSQKSAQSAATSAQESKNAAQGASESAAQSAQSADISAQAAQSAATSAQESKNAAQDASESAAQSARSADSSAQSAQSAATSAQESKNAAQGASESAAQSAQSASSSKQSAAEDAAAAQSAAQAASASAENAQSQKTAAQASANASATSATSAATSASNAAGYAANAQNAQSAAETAANNAATSEQNAAASATSAAKDAANAASSAKEAQDAVTAGIRPATSEQLGGVIVGETLKVENGKINLSDSNLSKINDTTKDVENIKQTIPENASPTNQFATKVDLTDYVKNTDYASASKGGVFKTGANYGTEVGASGSLYGCVETVQSLATRSNHAFISKGTLENIKNDLVKRAVTENDITLTDDEKTAAQDWLGIKQGASLPILMAMWSDHILDDMSWLRADTFSWQSGDVYVAAYQHLVEDVGAVTTYYCWEETKGGFVYTKSATPSVGDKMYYYENGVMIESSDDDIAGGTITNASDSYISNANGYSYARYASGDVDAFAAPAQTDTIGGITITYYLAEDGHKICTPDQESNIVALYEATGVAWYYILDTENKQFKLPRSKHNKYADTAPVVGTGKSIGFTPVNKAFSGNNALYPNEGAIGTTKTVYQANTAAGLGLSTDPSLSQVFAQQTQDTDQYKYLYFYVGNFTQDAVEQTAGITSEQLNNKADISLFNAIYPVGSIYIGTQSTCPMAIAIPGSSWELLEAGRALWTGDGSNGNTTIAAGLPNITGSAGVYSLQRNASSTQSGALYNTGATYYGYGSSTNNTGLTVNINASRSSSIYGNSTTVQPPAYVVNVWRRTA